MGQAYRILDILVCRSLIVSPLQASFLILPQASGYLSMKMLNNPSEMNYRRVPAAGNADQVI